jgi:hypothetical protein
MKSFPMSWLRSRPVSLHCSERILTVLEGNLVRCAPRCLKAWSWGLDLGPVVILILEHRPTFSFGHFVSFRPFDV